MTPHSGRMIEITSESVAIGDVINVGGLPLIVADLITLSARAKRVRFTTGETLTMHGKSRFAATRPDARLRPVRRW